MRVAVSRMEQGSLSNVEFFRGIGEYEIDWGPWQRIYLAKDGLKIVILIGGGTKKRQQQGTLTRQWRCGRTTNAARPQARKERSLHRMLSKSGNPTMSNVSAIFAAINSDGARRMTPALSANTQVILLLTAPPIASLPPRAAKNKYPAACVAPMRRVRPRDVLPGQSPGIHGARQRRGPPSRCRFR
jgi:putative component of toxin-antitoxin plasmid stabilization module